MRETVHDKNDLLSIKEDEELKLLIEAGKELIKRALTFRVDNIIGMIQ